MTDEATPAAVVPSPAESITIPSPVSANDTPAAADDPAPGSSETETPDSEAPKKPKSTVSERIGEITAKKKAAEADASLARQEVQRLRDELAKLRGTPTDTLPFDQADQLRVREAVKTERLEEKEAEVAHRDRVAKETRQASFVAKVEAVADRMPDLLEKFAAVTVSEQAAEIIADSDRAAEIAYYLANNPREAAEIAFLPAHLQGVRIARIEARVSAAPTVRKNSSAPSPVPTLKGGTSSPNVKDPGSMTMAEYSAWRKAGNS